MEKAYDILGIMFESGHIIIKLTEKVLSFQLSEISDRLSHATGSELLDYKVTPSGYGIHWKQLDEDISINGLLKLETKKHELKNAV